MNADITIVRQKLLDGAYTCVVCAQDREYSSYERGVKPLLSLLETGDSWLGAVAADKTVGAGAAYLYVLLRVRALWANVISVSALQILRDNGIDVAYAECVPHIINRRGDGVCPIEAAVADAQTASEAYCLIVDTLEKLQQNTES